MIFCRKHFISTTLLLIGAGIGFATTEFKDAEITTLKNIVEHDAGSGPSPAKVNEKISERSKVTTAAASMAELTFGDSSITRIGANSVFSFQSKERLVKLDQGTALIHATPGNGGATVDCGGVTAAVSGSTFMASRSSSGGAVFVLLESSGSLKVTTPNGQTAVIQPGQAASTGTGAKSGIQVFDVDVKKVVESSPLVQGFKKELPSQGEINQVSEKQQRMIREGKIEVLGVEVVATGQDGDLLVGAPRERPEPGAGGDGLDINTAAGGDAGPGNVAGAKPPPPPAAGPSMNSQGGNKPMVDSSFLAAQRKLAVAEPQGPTELKVTLPEGISEGALQAGAVTLNTPAVQAVPVTLVSASGRNITFSFPSGSTIPVGATSIPFTFTVADDGIISNGSSNLTALSIRAFASKLSAVGGGSLADGTSRVPSGLSSKDPLQFGSSENPFTIQLPGKLAADLESTVTVETFVRDQKIGEVFRKVLIRAGESKLALTGNILPDSKIYSSLPIETKLTVALDQIGQSFSKNINIQPRSLEDAVIRASNPLRGMLTTAYSSIKWDALPEATAYEIKVTQGNVSESKLILGTEYNWLGGLVRSTVNRVTALTSEIQTGALVLAQDEKFELIDKNRSLASDVRKNSVEIFLAVLNAAGEQVNSILMKDNGTGALWVTDDFGVSKKVASVDYDAGIVSLSEEALGKELPLAEVYYSASFVAENSINFTKLETSAGPAEDDLLQADKYFYFEAKVGQEGPTKFFAHAPLELDLAKSSQWGDATSWLSSEGLPAVDFDFYAANARIYLNDSGNDSSSQPDQVVFQSDKVVLYADKISLRGKLEKTDGTTTLLDVSLDPQGTSIQQSLSLVAGLGGIDMKDVVLDVNGANLTMETSAGINIESGTIRDVGDTLEMNAAKSVVMGAKSEGAVTQEETPAVTIQAKIETPNSMAVIRTGDSLELRRVVLKSFARGEVVSLSSENKGRVLMSASTARDFHINELVNAVIVADSKGQVDADKSSSPNLVALGADLTVEGSLPIKTAKYQGVDVHGYNVNLEASRIALSGARITAVNAITAKAQTLLVDSSILRVVNAAGSINLYSSMGMVNRQYGAVMDGMVNFAGSNTFQIGDQKVSLSSAQDIQNAFQRGIMIEGAASPVSGKINILPANNAAAATRLN